MRLRYEVQDLKRDPAAFRNPLQQLTAKDLCVIFASSPQEAATKWAVVHDQEAYEEDEIARNGREVIVLVTDENGVRTKLVVCGETTAAYRALSVK